MDRQLPGARVGRCTPGKGTNSWKRNRLEIQSGANPVRPANGGEARAAPDKEVTRPWTNRQQLLTSFGPLQEIRAMLSTGGRGPKAGEPNVYIQPRQA